MKKESEVLFAIDVYSKARSARAVHQDSRADNHPILYSVAQSQQQQQQQQQLFACIAVWLLVTYNVVLKAA